MAASGHQRQATNSDPNPDECEHMATVLASVESLCETTITRHADRSIKCGTSGNRVGCADELGEAVVSIEALAGTPLQRAVGACEGDRRDGDPPV